MKCPTCKDLGVKSRVYPGMSYATCMGWQPYYDEDGQYHSHDPNTTTTDYTCSNGHEWTNSQVPPCPSCLYGRKEKDDDDGSKKTSTD